MVGCVSRVQAQTPLPSPESPVPASADFLTHYNFHLAAESLQTDDTRFKWQTHFGGDFDVVDYRAGRANVLIDYEAVLGDELRAFDPNQGNYTLEVSGSVRPPGVEIAGFFHHVSRHLGDRPKTFAIAWNVLGVRALRRLDIHGTTIDLQGSYGQVVAHAWVDYSWTGDADVTIRRPVGPRIDVFAHGYGELVGVEAASTRDTQQGGRIEGGIRIKGAAGAAELFAGFERRIDADPIEQLRHEWVLVGFRFLSR